MRTGDYIFFVLCRQNGAGYNLGSSTCGSIASGNSIVFDSSTDRYLVIISYCALLRVFGLHHMMSNILCTIL